TLSFHSRRHQGAPASRSRRRNALVTPCSWMAAAVICLITPLESGGKQKGPCGAQRPHGPFGLRFCFGLEDLYRNRLNVRSREGRLRPRRCASSRSASMSQLLTNMDTPGWVWGLGYCNSGGLRSQVQLLEDEPGDESLLAPGLVRA